MLNDHPELSGQGKIVLPPYPEEQYQPYVQEQQVYVHPDQLRPKTPSLSGNPLANLRALWTRDPAYRVLIVATAMVLVAGLMFTVFLVNTFAQTTATPSTSQVVAPKGSVVAAPTSVANVPPTFPTPSGGQGSNQSSLPPSSAPVVLPTLTPSSQAQGSQPLALQITAFPQQVSNNSNVQVTVTANQPGVDVSLQITYDLGPSSTVGPQQTGGDNTATLNWHIRTFGFRMTQVARITAFATDQNGQQIQSQTVSVQVNGRQFG